jgi:F-type H+-transporting ATPase subunit b
MMRWISIGLVVGALLCAAPQFALAAEPHAAAEGDHGHGAHLGEDVSAAALDPSEWKADLAIFTLIVFLILFAALYKTAWPKISTALDEREAGIRRAIADADKARDDAVAALKAHQAKLDSVQEEVKEILAEARRDAERTKNDIMTSATTEATATKNRAIAEIERAKDQALNDLFSRMADQVAAATSQVVGRSVTSDDQSRLIREALTQVSAN